MATKQRNQIPKGKHGGELDVDNTKGFGPENIYWLVESDGPSSAKVKGPGPSGLYQWHVVYWGRIPRCRAVVDCNELIADLASRGGAAALILAHARDPTG